MSQSGLHAIAGLYVARLLRPRAQFAHPPADAEPGGPSTGEPVAETAAGGFKIGLVLGNVLPDVDLFIMGPAYLIYGPAAQSLHRTWSHSLLTQALLALLLFRFWAGGSAGRHGFVRGLWLGMAMHSAADIVLWFSGIDLLWPLGRLGVPGTVNLWAGLQPPAWVSNWLGAWEFLFLALFFAYLLKLSAGRPKTEAAAALLRPLNRLLYLLFAAFTLLAFVLAGSPSLFNVIIYTPLILFFLPLEFWVIFRLREVIARA